MNTRAFGKTGHQVSEIGLGTWQLGGTEWGDVDEAQCFAILAAAAEAGVTFFDTADIYGMGRSENSSAASSRSGPTATASSSPPSSAAIRSPAGRRTSRGPRSSSTRKTRCGGWASRPST